MPPVILVDGKPNPFIDALDRGLAYGDGVFRTMRAAAGRIPYWRMHYAKLAHDCGRLALDCPSEAVLLEDIARLLAVARDCIVKVVITRGAGGRGYAPPTDALPMRIVASFPLPRIPADRDATGIDARWCRTQVTMQPALAGVKHLNRLDSVLARGEWNNGEHAEGLMLDRDGWVIQGTMSNVFIVERDQLTTPVLDAAGVAGVQRERLMALAAQVGLECVEDRISAQRLLGADQVYVSNSVIGLWWLARLDDRCWERLDVTRLLLESIARTDDD